VPHVIRSSRPRRNTPLPFAYRLGSRSWADRPILSSTKRPGRQRTRAATTGTPGGRQIESPEGVANAGAIAKVDELMDSLMRTSDSDDGDGISVKISNPTSRKLPQASGDSCRKDTVKFWAGAGGELDP